MKYKWLIKEYEEISKDFLSVSFNSEIIAKLLLNRGINTPEAAKSYLNPNFYKESKPKEIPNLVQARDRIIEAINKKEKITIFGDYDVDGVTSTSCLLIALKQFTENIDFYIPSRLTEGYGLNKEAVKAIARKNVVACHGKPLLITCDCGITNNSEIELANSFGMDVIVTDHHSLPEILPPAYAVLNPKLLPPDHKLHFLPGVGVAYKLAEAVLDSIGQKGGWREREKERIAKSDLLDLVTLGMIADLAPLIDENRYLVQIGLPKLANTNKVGLQELLRMCGCLKNESENWRTGGKEKGTAPTTEHIGFGIAPRINAVGRLTDASLAVKLFTTDDLSEAVQIACELESQNRQRQLICEETLNEAITLVAEHVDLKNDKCIVLAKENWHHGVIGIVASRVLEKFNLPVILIGVDKEQNIARGSGRSIGALNITEALNLSSKHLERFGGHKAACGLSLKPENINDFILDFKNTVNNMLADSDLGPVLKIDLELPVSDLNIELINKINKLSPFGFGNRMAVFASEEVEIAGVRNIGKNGQHLKLFLKASVQEKTLEALIWNCDNRTDFKIGEKIKIVYTPKLNNFNGETSIQLEVKDWDLVGRTGEKEKIIAVYDYRGKMQECLEVLSSTQAIYFAEVEQKNYLPLKTNSRTNINQTENLVLLEIPPDENIFIEIVKKSNASKIYLAFEQRPVDLITRPVDLIKRLTGMLKYMQNNKSSKAKEIDLMCALGLNKSALAYALETLVKIGFLTYARTEEVLNINILNPNRQNFGELIEYKLFVSEFKQLLEFKEWLYKINIPEITKLLEKNSIATKASVTNRIEVVL